MLEWQEELTLSNEQPEAMTRNTSIEEQDFIESWQEVFSFLND